ncbi:MAG TPA: FRG domain-containing protein [Candidatus Cybelea sp.]
MELDEFGTFSAGSAYAYDANAQLLGAYAQIRLENEIPLQQVQVSLMPIDPRTNQVKPWNSIAAEYPNQVFPSAATVTVTIVSDDTLQIDAFTDVRTQISARVSKGRSGQASEYAPIPEVQNWEQFKAFAARLEQYQFILRGQDKPVRLRTSFHRSRRADVARFLTNDLSTLNKHLASRLRHVFNIAIPDDNGAFVALVQHHGYPTPLLDWTYSPFVAAFFAYRHVQNDRVRDDPNGSVRIFVLDKSSWVQRVRQLPMLRPYGLHFSILDVPSIENERLVPQQAVSTVTNVDDVESYIRSYDTDSARPLLQVIDLPVRDRTAVMRELSAMGITAGSMFPGLDGACEELKERFFLLG